MNPAELKQFSLLVEFSEEDREALAELLDIEKVASGRTMFREGTEADAMYLLKSGRLRLETTASGEMGLVCAGSWLGAISLMSIGVREATARAQDDCEVLVLSRPSFRRLVEDAPTTACRLAEAVVGDLAAQLRPHLALVQRELSSDDVVVSG